MKVVHFAETLPGGIATYLNELLAFQVQNYESVSVVCADRDAPLIDCEGVEIIRIRYGGRRPSSLMELARHWRNEIRLHSSDIIHLHSSFAGVIGRLISKPKGASIVYCAHGWSHARQDSRLKTLAYRTVERFLAARTDRILNVSDSERKRAREAGIPDVRCRTVYTGLSDTEYAPEVRRPDEPLRLLFVGRYDVQKGIDLLFGAAAKLQKGQFSIETIGKHVVGRPLFSHTPEGICDRGWCAPHEVTEAMRRADVVVIPSRWEGFSIVALEAIRAGRPIIASSIDSLKEVVTDGDNGVIFEAGSATDLANAISRIADMDLAAMGRRGRERFVEHFRAERMYREVDGLYQELLAEDRTRAA